MSKIELPTVTGNNNISRINDNFKKIEDALNQEVLYRKGYVGEPNEMETNLDMNGKEILNVATGTSDGSLVTKSYVDQSLSLKFDKSGGPLSGPVDMQNNQINNLPNATQPSQPATYAQLLQVEAPGDSLLRNELAEPGGAELVGFLQYGEGAVQRTVQRRLLDSINVKDFGALGDGITDDSIAIQKALTRAGEQGRDLYFPSGRYVINSTCTLPIQSISVHGCWSNTVITGSADKLFALPTVIGKVHTISRLSFEYAGTAIAATKIWSAAGIEPSCIVSECRFKSLAANSKAITLSGIWAARVYGNSFAGTGKTANETAISIVTGDNMNTSVMNTDIQNNSTVSIAYPVKYTGRTLSSGGRVEGVTILGNKFVAGKTGIWLSQTLATCISGNMCSDFDDYAIDLFGDFDFTIVGNMDLSGGIVGIRLNELAGSILERGVITGNKIPLKASTGGILFNAPSGGVIRGISICGNIIGKSQSGTKALYGIKYIGTSIANIAITGNTFMYIDKAIDRNGDVGSSTINGNSYASVGDTGVSSPHNTPFTASIVETLVGGTSHTLTVPLPAGAARDKPFFASCILASVVGGSPLLGIYKYDTSTKDQLQFNIVRADGSTLPSVAVRFAVAALPF